MRSRNIDLDQVLAFAIFDLPVRIGQITTQFASLQQQYQAGFSTWNHLFIRKKMIYGYWYQHVKYHLLALLLASALMVIPFNAWTGLLPGLLLAASIAVPTLIIFIYFPVFYNDYLPKLDMITAEQEQLMAAEKDLTKCKSTQFPMPVLMVIYYVFSKLSNIPLPPANDQFAVLLNQLFGRTPDKLKANLSRLYKPAGLPVRERAEMRKAVDQARQFFWQLDCPAAEKVLNELDQKLLPKE